MRGLRAPLSPHEEITLRRIALATAGGLSRAHLGRLQQLGLVEQIAGDWRLTDLGHQRYAALPRPLLWEPHERSDQLSRMMEAVYKKD